MVGALPTSNCLLRKLCWRLTLLRTYTILHVVLFAWLGNHDFALHVLLRKVLKLQCLRHVSKISRSVMISWGMLGCYNYCCNLRVQETMCLTSTNPQDRPEKALEAAKAHGHPKAARDTLRILKGYQSHPPFYGRWWPMMAYDGVWWPMSMSRTGKIWLNAECWAAWHILWDPAWHPDRMLKCWPRSSKVRHAACFTPILNSQWWYLPCRMGQRFLDAIFIHFQPFTTSHNVRPRHGEYHSDFIHILYGSIWKWGMPVCPPKWPFHIISWDIW